MPQQSFAKLRLPPGIHNDQTAYASSGHWVDADKVRFWKNYPEMIGGWTEIAASAHTGICRAIFDSRDLTRNEFTLFGTDQGLFVLSSGALSDLTPTAYVPGSEGVIDGDGFGVGTYGSSTYGTSRTNSLAGQFVQTWSFDYWGQDYILCAATLDGIYQWDLAPTNIATPVSAAPTSNLGVFVTPERHAVAVGAGGNFRVVQWCDQENLADWDYTSAINTAGRFTIPTGSLIVAWLRVPGGTLLWTDTDLWLMSYVGWPDIYRFDKVGSNCGTIGQKAVVESSGIVYWMGPDKFFYFDGAVRELSCPVEREIFQSITTSAALKSHAGISPRFSEIWFHYPADGASEPSRYAIFNFEEGWWSIGSMSRSAWTRDSRVRTPIAASPSTQKLYLHEDGETANGSPLKGHIVSAPREMDSGGQTMRVNAIVPDLEATNGFKITVGVRFMPAGSLYEYAPIEFTPTDTRKPLMLAGRQARVKIESLDTGGFWRLGDLRFDMRGAGPR